MPIATGQNIDPDDFIKVADRNTTPSNDEGRVPQLEGDARIHDYYLAKNFGDGSDGDVNLDGSNTYAGFMSKSGSTYTLTRHLYADDLTVQTGCTLVTDGFRIFVAGILSGAGTIKWGTPNAGATGSAGVAAGTAAGGAGGAQGGTGPLKNQAGATGAVSQSDGNISAPVAGVASTNLDPAIGSVGGSSGGGGAGDSGSNGSGASGGSITAPDVRFAASRLCAVDMVHLSLNATIEKILGSSGGAGGGGGGSDDDAAGTGGGGGGGGASGGIVWIAARIWAGTFTIEAQGGAGGAGGAARTSVGAADLGGGGGGGGGAGGVTIVIYGVKLWTGSYSLAGGAGGAGGAKNDTGLAGSAGSTGATGQSYELMPGYLL